jgi:UTP--glucose-1-phosphate uridylyltransferase
LCLKPIVQLVFEQLYQVGFREFCFIVGRGKRAIEDHFKPDLNRSTMLDSKGKDGLEDYLVFRVGLDSPVLHQGARPHLR